jgi:hypothetical protein
MFGNYFAYLFFWNIMFIIKCLQFTFIILKAFTMDCHLGPHFQIPAGSVISISLITLAVVNWSSSSMTELWYLLLENSLGWKVELHFYNRNKVWDC